MPRFVSVNGESYGVWGNGDGTGTGDAVPAAKKTTEINNKITKSQAEHTAAAKNTK